MLSFSPINRYRLYRHIKHGSIKTYEQRHFSKKYLFTKWQRYYKLSLSITHLDIVRELVILKEYFRRWNCDNNNAETIDITKGQIIYDICSTQYNYNSNNSGADLLALAMMGVDENDNEDNHDDTTILSTPSADSPKTTCDINSNANQNVQYQNMKQKKQQKIEELLAAGVEHNLIRRKRILNALNYQNPNKTYQPSMR